MNNASLSRATRTEGCIYFRRLCMSFFMYLRLLLEKPDPSSISTSQPRTRGPVWYPCRVFPQVALPHIDPTCIPCQNTKNHPSVHPTVPSCSICLLITPLCSLYIKPSHNFFRIPTVKSWIVFIAAGSSRSKILTMRNTFLLCFAQLQLAFGL